MRRSATSYGERSSTSSRGRGLSGFAAEAFGPCLGRFKLFKSIPKEVAARDLSQTSRASSEKRNRSVRSNGMTNSRRQFSGLINLKGPPETETTVFTLTEIKEATDNFSPTHKIGQGGFGTVYRGVLDGKVVAIKRGKKILYDKNVDLEFQREVTTLSSIEHLNLVRFLGYLESGEERILVVEYVPNGTLREHLDGTRRSLLDLATRLDIAVDVAHAITYLHMYADRPIIHRDVKSSNILLTDSLRAKVADFGFARLGSLEDGESNIYTQVRGTAGYMDPEYLRTSKLSEKSDVYSFGVLLIELVSGRRPIETKREMKQRSTSVWAMKKYMDGNAMEILDPNLPQDPSTSRPLEQILELACECLASPRRSRPTMRRCAEILWSVRKEYRQNLSSDKLSRFSNSKQNHSEEIGPRT